MAVDEIGFTRGVPRFGVMVGQPEMAAFAERVGLDSVWVGDHVYFRVPTRESLTLLAMFAAVTSKIRIGTAVLQTPMRHPYMLAKIVATIQELSRGRVQLGLGVGGDFGPEFEVLGVPTRERGTRTDESIQIVESLLSGERVNFAGRHFTLADVELAPKVSRPPILIGGRAEAAVRRAARFGEGYFPYLCSPDQVRQRKIRLAEVLAENGRSPQAMTEGCNLLVIVVIDEEANRGLRTGAAHLARLYGMPFEDKAHRYVIAGTPAMCEERLIEYWLAGVDEFTMQILDSPSGGRSLEKSIEALATLAESTRRLAASRTPVSGT